MPPRKALTGLGATRSDWDAAHEKASGYSDGAVYGPLLADGQPTYAAVVGDDRIFMYTVMMDLGTPLDTAVARIRSEFPADAVPGEVTSDGSCYIQLWRSEALEAAIDPSVGAVFYVGILDDPSYPTDHVEAIVTTVDAADPGSC